MTSQLDGSGSGEYADRSSLDSYIWALPHVEMKIPSSNSRATSAEAGIRRDEAWRSERVATAAYYLAADRGFKPGHEAEDWALAELQTDAIDAGRRL